MIDALARFLTQRSARERWLLALLVLIAAPLAFALLVVQPLLAGRDAARDALAQAQAEREWYAEQQALLAQLPRVSAETDSAAPVTTTPIGLGAFDAQLDAAGFVPHVTRLESTPAQGMELSLQGVAFEALMPWLYGLAGETGYDVLSLRVEAGNAAGRVDAEVSLAPVAE